jgi:chorismate mutase / prephenate dehydratase
MSLAEYREQITAVDGELLEAINRRLALVQELHAHKAEEGIPQRDLDREQALVRALQEANGGPLSDAGVAAFFEFVIALTRTEMYGA